jgi:hypothetical protein
MKPKLAWSKAQNGNWNGKRGPFTLMAVTFHADIGAWMVHSKLPGLRTVLTFQEAALAVKAADGLFDEWMRVVNG